MGGFSSDVDLEVPSLTLVLVGKTGNGKSATGNSILGWKSFESKRCSSAVTSKSASRQAVLANGQIVNVIDTPGLFDASVDKEFIGKEIVSCINMGIDGIDAFVVVFSVCRRFSEEEKAVINSLLNLFGAEVYNYMIVVFTGGDELENDDKTLDDFLSDSPESLKEILHSCGNRYVIFNNRTTDLNKRANQLKELLSLEKAAEVQRETEKLQALKEINHFSEEEALLLIEKMRDDVYKPIIEMFLSKLEQLVGEERAFRLKIEENARAEQKKSEEEMQNLKEVLKRLEDEEAERKQREGQKKGGGCFIL